MSDDPDVAAVILAAGSSSRMGDNKLLLALGGAGETVVARAVRVARAAGLAPVVVVLGHEAARVRAAVEDALAGAAPVPALRFVINPAHAEGKGTSLQAGIAEVAIATEARAALVLLADMPLVTAGMVGAVAGHYRDSGATMVASRYGDVNAPPILYDRALFAELLALPPHACGKEMVRRHRDDAEVLSWPEEALADIDRPEDYQRIRAVLEGGGRS